MFPESSSPFLFVCGALFILEDHVTVSCQRARPLYPAVVKPMEAMSESDDAVKSWAAIPAAKKRWVRKDRIRRERRVCKAKIRRVHLFIMCKVAEKALAEWEGKLLRVKKAPRRLSLRQIDFLKFGSTEGCKGCAWISHRLGRHPGHNNVCRKKEA